MSIEASQGGMAKGRSELRLLVVADTIRPFLRRVRWFSMTTAVSSSEESDLADAQTGDLAPAGSHDR